MQVKCMLRQAVFLCILFMFVNAALAQEQTKAHLDSILRKGSWSMQFRMTTLLSFINLEGSILSAKYHFASRHALRIGLSANVDNSIRDNSKFTTIDTTQTNIRENTTNPGRGE